MTRHILRFIRNLLLLFFVSSIAAVAAYRFIPVSITPLMLIRAATNMADGKPASWHHRWVPLDSISAHLPMAVIASEDNNFATHHGFDFEQIQKALEENKTRKRPRGASTISQQTAKNVFLWPESSWVRKGLEVYFTVLIETMWDKERIMEVYLNSIEMGDGIYGADAVARQHFGTTASKLSKAQCALIAATLPNPLRYDSAHPSAYMLQRQAKILILMNLVAKFPADKKKD